MKANQSLKIGHQGFPENDFSYNELQDNDYSAIKPSTEMDYLIDLRSQGELKSEHYTKQ